MLRQREVVKVDQGCPVAGEKVLATVACTVIGKSQI